MASPSVAAWATSARKHGLTIDKLLAADLVTAEGEVVTADEEHLSGSFLGDPRRWRQFRRRDSVQVPAGADARVHRRADGPARDARDDCGLHGRSADAPEALGTIANVMPCPPLPFVPQETSRPARDLRLLGFSGTDDEAAAALAPFRALKPLADLVKPEPYPDMYPPEDETYRPKALDYTFFMDHVDLATAQTIIDRLQASDAALRAVQLRVWVAPWRACRQTRQPSRIATLRSWPSR